LPNGREYALETLHKEWPFADLVEETISTQHIIDRISFSSIHTTLHPLQVYLSGSNFQLKVWEALLRIPPGNVVSYRDIAGFLGEPDASRAVGNALARNPIAVLIPCHRVIHSLGDFGQYHYGAERKIALLGWEMAKVATMGS
jgi:AraC family transcriptional regulator of adaptative response/methylated-DNA-[protein]-cysteine methyltransferase